MSDTPRSAAERIATRIMARRNAASGLAVFVDPVIIESIAREEMEAEDSALRAANDRLKDDAEKWQRSNGYIEAARAEAAESERDALRVKNQRLGAALRESYEILEALRLSVQWELSPVIKDRIASCCKRVFVLLADPLSSEPSREKRLDAALRSLVADWRERARVVRPLETSPISSEKRERTKEWMFYTNRASEAEALLADPPSETGKEPK